MLAPSYELTLGSRRWTQQVLSIDVQVAAAPVPDLVAARFPPAANVNAAPGDDLVLRVDGGDGSEDVVTGTVDRIAHTFEEIVVSGSDAGGRLTRSRPAITFEKATAATVIRALCSDAGAEAGQLDDGVQLAYYAADPTRHAYEHVARLASWSGAVARVDADGRVSSLVVQMGKADVALRYGRDVVALEALTATRPVETFVVAGESGVGASDDLDAMRPSTDFFGGDRPDGPGPAARWVFEPALRTTDAARDAREAWAKRYLSEASIWRLTVLLRPALRPGLVLEVADLPDRFAGSKFVVERVRHQISPTRAWTIARLASAGTGAGGLAGAASALVGTL
jgi:hypothetical protein